MTGNRMTTKPPVQYNLPPLTPAALAMDVSSLIQMVREREPLWNRQHPQYKDRELAAMLWGEVAGRLKVDVETARYKWRGLRDTYRVQLRKLNRPGLQGIKQHIVPSRWEYFNEMSFVKDHIYLDINSKLYKTKKFKGNSSDIEGNIDEEGSGEDEYPNFGILCETEMTEGEETLDEHFQEIEPIKTEENDDSTESIPLKLSDSNTSFEKLVKNGRESFFPIGYNSLEDDNFCFLLSILPQLKALPSKRNLYVRLKMQELILNEVLSLHRES